MKQEPLIRCDDKSLLSQKYFMTTQEALEEHPTADNIHFSIVTYNGNLKLSVPIEERSLNYEVTIAIQLQPLRDKHTDIDLYTASVLLALFDKYKRDLVLH